MPYIANICAFLVKISLNLAHMGFQPVDGAPRRPEMRARRPRHSDPLQFYLEGNFLGTG
jgi:hypothetical protein